MPEFTLSVPVGERVRKAGGFEFVVDSWGRTSNGRVWVEGKSDAGVRRNAWLDSVTIVPSAPEGPTCEACGRVYEDWASDDALWQEVQGSYERMLCFDCFAIQARAHDVRISVERWYCPTCDDAPLLNGAVLDRREKDA